MNEKDFDKWNELKKKIEKMDIRFYCKPRDIWWCYLGLNIGSEQDGKNELFERPVIVLKVFSKEMVRVAPLTSRLSKNRSLVRISYQNKINSVVISQIRTISTKRLIKKVFRLDSEQFNLLLAHIIVDVL